MTDAREDLVELLAAIAQADEDLGWRCCDGPHTAHDGNPYAHAVNCPIKLLRRTADRIEERHATG